MPVDSALGLLGLVVAVLLFAGLYARREGIAFVVRGMLRGITFGTITTFVAIKLGGARDDTGVLLGFLVYVIVLARLRPRKRRISARVRRRVIAKWELEKGKKFNSRFQELDHIVPFSKGGSNTEDNLRVVDKEENRSKGSRSARWDILSRH